MYMLYTILTLTTAYFFYKKFKNYLLPEVKSFDDEEEICYNEYTFLRYNIVYKDGTIEIILNELEQEEIFEMNDKNSIKFIVIDYLFNKKFMRYLSYDLDITFPMYDNITLQYNNNDLIDEIYINNKKITYYVIPFLGPKDNFYKDKMIKLDLRDILYDHPSKDDLNYENGHIKITTLYEKEIIYNLPWTPVWKPCSGDFDKTLEINNIIENNSNDSIYGFSIIDPEKLKTI